MINLFKKSNQADEAPSAKAKVIALMNQKGGVGKTTMAFNLAHALSQNKKVLCLDLDPQANFSSLFGVDDAQTSIFHMMINSIRELRALHTPSLVSEAIYKVSDNIDLIASSQDLSGFELTVAGISSPRQLVLKKFLEKNDLLNRYDYVVIDGPPTLGLLVVNILCSVDGVLFPFIPDSFSEQGLKNIHQVVLDIEEMGITQTPKILGYIPNLYEERRKQSKSDFEHIKDNIVEAKVFNAFRNRAPMAKSMAKKKSVFDFSSVEYKELQSQFNEMASYIQQELQ